jgi:hypothetical protein
MKLTINGTSFDVNIEDVKKAMESENPSFTITDENFVVRSKEDETTFIENHKKDARKEGVEIAVKNARNELNLDFQGKTVENLIKAVQGKAISEAKVEPNERIESLTKDVEMLQSKLSESNQTLEEQKNRYTELQNGYKIDSTLKGLIEKRAGENLALPLNQVMTIFKTTNETKLGESGNVEFYQNGQLMKDDVLNPLGGDSVINKFFDENPHFLKTPSGGSGGNDSSGMNGKMSIDQFNKKMTDLGHTINSQEYVNQMTAEIEAGNLDL